MNQGIPIQKRSSAFTLLSDRRPGSGSASVDIRVGSVWAVFGPEVVTGPPEEQRDCFPSVPGMEQRKTSSTAPAPGAEVQAARGPRTKLKPSRCPFTCKERARMGSLTTGSMRRPQAGVQAVSYSRRRSRLCEGPNRRNRHFIRHNRESCQDKNAIWKQKIVLSLCF